MPLPSWTNAWTRWLKRQPDATAALPPTAVPAPPPAPPSAAAAIDVPDDEARLLFLRWLLARPAGAPPMPTAEAAAPASPIAQLDATLANDAALAGLLPRAAQVVPHLMKTLRDERYSAADVAQRIAKDVVLTTEVMRLANSVHHAGREPVVDLGQAVAALGTTGLQRAIAKVVLRPIFESRSAPLSLQAAPRIWQNSDNKARLCVALAPGFALDPLDAYLAGLLHDIGWTAAFRILDGARPIPVRAEQLTVDPALAEALFVRRDRLFGKLVRPWQLSAGLTALANDLAGAGLDAAVSPLAEALKLADRLAAHHGLQQANWLPPGEPTGWPTLPPAVQNAYAALRQAAAAQ